MSNFWGAYHDLECLFSMVNNNYNIRELRNHFFAHLDKKAKFSSIRMMYKIDYIDDLEMIIGDLIEKFTNLYTMCFGETTILKDNIRSNFEIPKLELINDINIRANEFFKKHPFLKNWFYVDKEGLHYKKDIKHK